MTIIYHRKKTGRIYKCYRSNGMCAQELEQRRREYNLANKDTGDVVETAELEPGSITEFLFLICEKIKFRPCNLSTLEDLAETLDEGLTLTYELIDQAKKWAEHVKEDR